MTICWQRFASASSGGIEADRLGQSYGVDPAQQCRRVGEGGREKGGSGGRSTNPFQDPDGGPSSIVSRPTANFSTMWFSRSIHEKYRKKHLKKNKDLVVEFRKLSGCLWIGLSAQSVSFKFFSVLSRARLEEYLNEDVILLGRQDGLIFNS